MVKSLFVPLALSLSVAFNIPYAIAAPAAANYAQKEGFDSIPKGWEQISAPSPSQVLNLRLLMAPADANALEQLILNIATPGHSLYGKFLSPEKLKEHAAPSSAASEAVTSWLTGNNLASDAIQNDGSYLTFQLPVEQAEKILQTQFYNYKSTATGEVRTLTLAYSVPKSILDYVETIQPTTDFTELPSNPTIQTLTHELNASDFNSATDCGKYVTPNCLQRLYGLPDANAETPQGGIVVPGFLNEYASHSDLNTFLQETRPQLSPRPSFTVATLDGGQNDESNPGIEASLDIQYTAGLANGIQTHFISVGQPSATGFIDTINKLLSQETVPSVVSLSYGFDEYALTPSVATNMCNLFGRLGARGVSVLVASGDGGVAGSRPTTCEYFLPTFPASCPWITSVGATTGTPTEVGSELSAGGFSNLFSRPLYQEIAVTEYLGQLGSNYRGLYNPKGRAYPDVSAQGQSVYIVVNNKGVLVDGTSASAPIFASTIALLNAQRNSQPIPLPPLGFLNPWLYLQSDVLNDVTTGNNPGCSTTGFNATAGWDPVTGLGTPNFSKMQTLL